jgi:hypothetical protein
MEDATRQYFKEHKSSWLASCFAVKGVVVQGFTQEFFDGE